MARIVKDRFQFRGKVGRVICLVTAHPVVWRKSNRGSVSVEDTFVEVRGIIIIGVAVVTGIGIISDANSLKSDI